VIIERWKRQAYFGGARLPKGLETVGRKTGAAQRKQARTPSARRVFRPTACGHAEASPHQNRGRLFNPPTVPNHQSLGGRLLPVPQEPQHLAVNRLHSLGRKPAVSGENAVDDRLLCLIIDDKGDATRRIDQRKCECEPVGIELRDEIWHHIPLRLLQSSSPRK